MPYRIKIPIQNTPTVPYYSVPYRIYGGDINTMTLFPALGVADFEPDYASNYFIPQETVKPARSLR